MPLLRKCMCCTTEAMCRCIHCATPTDTGLSHRLLSWHCAVPHTALSHHLFSWHCAVPHRHWSVTLPVELAQCHLPQTLVCHTTCWSGTVPSPTLHGKMWILCHEPLVTIKDCLSTQQDWCGITMHTTGLWLAQHCCVAIATTNPQSCWWWTLYCWTWTLCETESLLTAPWSSASPVHHRPPPHRPPLPQCPYCCAHSLHSPFLLWHHHWQQLTGERWRRWGCLWHPCRCRVLETSGMGLLGHCESKWKRWTGESINSRKERRQTYMETKQINSK